MLIERAFEGDSGGTEFVATGAESSVASDIANHGVGDGNKATRAAVSGQLDIAVDEGGGDL